MSSEWCPACQKWHGTRISTSHRQATDEQGNAVQIVTSSYHCETCGAFLRSEDVEQLSENDLNESGQEE